MHDGMPYGRNQGQGQGHSREVDRQSPTGLIFIVRLDVGPWPREPSPWPWPSVPVKSLLTSLSCGETDGKRENSLTTANLGGGKK